MNLNPPFSVPSSAADAQRGVAGLDATMLYSPSHLGLHPEPVRNHPGQLSGLGIYQGAMEPLPSQPRISSRVEPMHLPMNEWQGSTVPGHSVPNTLLSASGAPDGAIYQGFGGRSLPSNAGLDFAHYSPNNMDLSQNYAHGTGLCPPRNTFYNQPSSPWPVTPSSRATTPSTTSVRVKEELDGTWEPPFFRDPRDECHAHAMSTIAHAMVDNPSYSQIPSGQHNGKDIGEDADIEWPAKRGRSSSVDHSSIELSPKSEKDTDIVALGRDIASMRGLQCSVCGYLFTRRSNCREHMKRHDPNQRKGYDCETCGKTFGRRTDLKRHIESIHHGTRRFGCDQCGRRFTRHDTLTRHCADGCKRKPQKQDQVESPLNRDPSEQYPSPSPSFENSLSNGRLGSLEQPLMTPGSLQPGPMKPPLGTHHSPTTRK